MNQKYGNIDCTIFWNWLKYRTLQYLYVPFSNFGPKMKAVYILAGAAFVKMAGFRQEQKSGTALLKKKLHTISQTTAVYWLWCHNIIPYQQTIDGTAYIGHCENCLMI